MSVENGNEMNLLSVMGTGINKKDFTDSLKKILGVSNIVKPLSMDQKRKLVIERQIAKCLEHVNQIAKKVKQGSGLINQMNIDISENIGHTLEISQKTYKDQLGIDASANSVLSKGIVSEIGYGDESTESQLNVGFEYISPETKGKDLTDEQIEWLVKKDCALEEEVS